jgi:hypothetical protein
VPTCAHNHTHYTSHTHTHCLFASQAVFHSTICLVITRTPTRKGGGRGVHSQHHHHTSSRIANRLCCVSHPVFTPSMLRVASPHARAFTLSLPTSSAERENTHRNLSHSHTAQHTRSQTRTQAHVAHNMPFTHDFFVVPPADIADGHSSSIEAIMAGRASLKVSVRVCEPLGLLVELQW